MRLFIAIKIPEDIKEYISELQKQIDTANNKISLVNKDNIHITMKLLGEVQPNDIETIKESLNNVKFKSFSVHLNDVDVFPNENYIRVIWIGLEPEENILELQKNIDESLKSLFRKEKDFKPHLTLARVKYIEDKNNFINKLKNIKIENKKIDISNFRLVKSTLTPEGPVYEDLEVFK